MKKFLPVFYFCCLQFFASAQNLVPNADFENHIGCPANFGDFYPCVDWEAVANTPDYFNTCATGPNVSVPLNGAGYQMPLSGAAYAGTISFVTATNYREIIQAQLNAPLNIGQSYSISFNIVSGFSSIQAVNLVSNKMGIRLSTVSYNLNNPPLINNWAHLYTDEVIFDTLNWVNLQGALVADSAYQYILIGNFFDEQHTTVVQIGQYFTKAYYYIEDVCIASNEDQCAWGVNTVTLQSDIDWKIFPNPCNELLHVTGGKGKQGYAIISNVIGEQLLRKEWTAGENHFTFDTLILPEGTYSILIEEGDQVFTKSFIIQH